MRLGRGGRLWTQAGYHVPGRLAPGHSGRRRFEPTRSGIGAPVRSTAPAPVWNPQPSATGTRGRRVSSMRERGSARAAPPVAGARRRASGSVRWPRSRRLGVERQLAAQQRAAADVKGDIADRSVPLAVRSPSARSGAVSPSPHRSEAQGHSHRPRPPTAATDRSHRPRPPTAATDRGHRPQPPTAATDRSHRPQPPRRLRTRPPRTERAVPGPTGDAVRAPCERESVENADAPRFT